MESKKYNKLVNKTKRSRLTDIDNKLVDTSGERKGGRDNIGVGDFFFFFLAALGLPCCVRAFSSCGERGLLFIAVRGLLIAVASLVAEHGL